MTVRNHLRHNRIDTFLVGISIMFCMDTAGLAQPAKPRRVERPTFRVGAFEGIFFADPAAQLQGELPAAASQNAQNSSATATNPAANSPSNSGSDDPQEWKRLIAPTSLEDLVKAGKLRLDKIVTTPTAFKGGGFVAARTEFSLQALLFAIIETYPGEVRWKNSAALARQRFARVAANTKVGSDQVFAEVKARMLDLQDLIGGTPLSVQADGPSADIDWSNLVDRVPLMQLLEWAHEENLAKLVASEADFKDNSEAVQRYAELVAVLGQLALANDMPDANDEDYRTLANAMIEQASMVVQAVKTNSAEQARMSAAQVGQACTNCHDSFR